MWKKSKKTYIAGDDDQAIFQWAGADIDHFIALKEEVDEIKVLEQSYRIPGGPIHELSQRIIANVSNRYDKVYKPREDTGVLKYHSDVTQGLTARESCGPDTQTSMVFSCFAVIGGQESQGPGHLREQAPAWCLVTI